MPHRMLDRHLKKLGLAATEMNAIIGLTSLLLDSRLEPEVAGHVATIRASGDSVLALINDILDFSKIESVELPEEPVALPEEPVALPEEPVALPETGRPADLRVKTDLKLLGPKVLSAIIGKFLESAEQQAAAIRDAIERDDMPALEHATHSLKGSSGTIGADRLSRICAELESGARQGTVTAAEEQLEELGHEIDRVRAFFGSPAAGVAK